MCVCNAAVIQESVCYIYFTLADAGFCDCPDLVPMVGTGQPGTPVAPLPPPGQL